MANTRQHGGTWAIYFVSLFHVFVNLKEYFVELLNF